MLLREMAIYQGKKNRNQEKNTCTHMLHSSFIGEQTSTCKAKAGNDLQERARLKGNDVFNNFLPFSCPYTYLSNLRLWVDASRGTRSDRCYHLRSHLLSREDWMPHTSAQASVRVMVLDR